MFFINKIFIISTLFYRRIEGYQSNIYNTKFSLHINVFREPKLKILYVNNII